MSTKRHATLLSRLATAGTEEAVKAAWAKCFDLEIDTRDDHDLYPDQVLFEFKLERNFDQPLHNPMY